MKTVENINQLIQTLKSNELMKTKDVSDGYHTFGQLYHDRAVLFAVICNTYKEHAWKATQHYDGTMFGGPNEMFIVGITTPEGDYTYHYEMEYWDMYQVKELDKAPKWDGHTFRDISRLHNLVNAGDTDD